MEWKLFDGDVPYVSTFDYHQDRPRAPHAEQPPHRPRLDLALSFVQRCEPNTVIDLGCGDGGFMAMMRDTLTRPVHLSGFDFCPANAAAWDERGVGGYCWEVNVFPEPPGPVIDAAIKVMTGDTDVAVMTEILEHIARPHEVLKEVDSKYLVASSPWSENDRSHDECHAWAWDMAGYRRLVEDAGFVVIDHQKAGFSQVILARRTQEEE